MTRRSLTIAAVATVLAPALAVARQGATVQATVPDGKTTFETVCSTCHTLEAPPNKAPPMTHVARRYRMMFKTEAEGVEAITAWIADPDTSRSRMPAMAIQRFGVMAPLPLPEAQRREVARYVWRLGMADTAHVHPPR